MLTPLPVADYKALASFRYSLRRFLRYSRAFLRARARLTPEQYEALLALKVFAGSNGLTIGELSERLQVKHHTAVELADKLVARRVASRRTSRKDRRRVHLKLSPEGEDLLETLAAAHRKEIRHFSGEMIDALNHLRA
jgi:DNA-binding MarR family transcriptional regulator